MFGELTNPEAKNWIWKCTLSVVNVKQELSESTCCIDCRAACTMVELGGDEVFFTVRIFRYRGWECDGGRGQAQEVGE